MGCKSSRASRRAGRNAWGDVVSDRALRGRARSSAATGEERRGKRDAGDEMRDVSAQCAVACAAAGEELSGCRLACFLRAS